MDAILAASSLSGSGSLDDFPLKLLADTAYSTTQTMEFGAGGCAWSIPHYGSSSDSNIYEFINPVLTCTSTSKPLTITSANAQIYSSIKDFRSNYSMAYASLKINSFIGTKVVSFKPFFVATRSTYNGNDALEIHLEINLWSQGTGTASFKFASKMRVWGASHVFALL